MSEQRHQDSQYKSARTSPNSTALEFSEAVPLGADILLDWDRSGSEGLSDLAQVLKGQQSEYGGHLFDQLVDSDEDRSRFNPALERYTQIIPGERFEPDEQHFKVFIAAANHRSFEPRSSIIFGGERCDSVFLLLRGMVSVHIDGAAGREVIVDYLSAGEFFGELPMFLDSWQRSAGVKAKCHCELAELSYARFRALYRSSIPIFCLHSRNKWPTALCEPRKKSAIWRFWMSQADSPARSWNCQSNPMR